MKDTESFHVCSLAWKVLSLVLLVSSSYNVSTDTNQFIMRPHCHLLIYSKLYNEKQHFVRGPSDRVAFTSRAVVATEFMHILGGLREIW